MQIQVNKSNKIYYNQIKLPNQFMTKLAFLSDTIKYIKFYIFNKVKNIKNLKFSKFLM